MKQQKSSVKYLISLSVLLLQMKTSVPSMSYLVISGGSVQFTNRCITDAI